MLNLFEQETRPWHLVPRNALYLVEPPEGEVRSFGDDRPTLATGLIAMGATTTAIAVIVVALRLYTRSILVKYAVATDDYLAIVSLCFSLALLGFLSKLTSVGMGNHMWDVPLSDYSPHFLMYTICSTISYALSISFSKLSILAFYLRLCPARWFRVLVWSLIGFVIAYSIAYFFLSIFGCSPIEASWDLSIQEPKCMDKLTLYMVLSIANIIMDFCTLALPIPVVIPLQMARRQKISLLLLFATGTLVCAIAIRRTAILPPLMSSPNYTRDAVEQFYWCFAEVNVGILCAAAPALKPFFIKYLPALLRSSLNGSGHGGASRSKSGITSHGLTTTTESNKKRREMASQSYELHSRGVNSDDGDMFDKARHGEATADDEATLWPGGRGHSVRGGQGHVFKGDIDESSMDSLEVERISPSERVSKHGPACVVSADKPARRAKGAHEGISVTKETTVKYSPR